jgi:hypothetical protein
MLAPTQSEPAFKLTLIIVLAEGPDFPRARQH